jgi:hypothetical protein
MQLPLLLDGVAMKADVQWWKGGGAGWNRTTKQRLCRPFPDRLGSAPLGETNSSYLKKYIRNSTRQASSCQD